MLTKRKLITMLNLNKRMKTFCTKIIRYKMIGVIEIIWALHFLNIHKRLDAQPLIYTMLTCHYTCSYLVRFCSHILFSFFFLPLVLALCLFNVLNWLVISSLSCVHTIRKKIKNKKRLIQPMVITLEGGGGE